MRIRRWLFCFALLLFVRRLSAQESVPWHDPSPHTVRFVSVDENVKLEVLDWGGSGRPLVLLAGLGATAHIYDDFAQKLTPAYHVYAITRRGFGASSAPDSGYSADRLGDDVLAVVDALKLDRPVLVGHSMGGEELSSIGTRHPERVAGLIYLDGAYGYAYYDRSHGYFDIDLQELRKKLDQLRTGQRPADPKQLIQDLQQTSLLAFERDLQRMQEDTALIPPPKFPSPTSADRESYVAALSWQERVLGYSMPEAELRQENESTPEGHVGRNRANPSISEAILSGEQKYSDIRVPILAIFAVPHDFGSIDSNDPVTAAFIAADTTSTDTQASAFEMGEPSARVVRLPHANHVVFISNREEVLREMKTFLTSLH